MKQKSFLTFYIILIILDQNLQLISYQTNFKLERICVDFSSYCTYNYRNYNGNEITISRNFRLRRTSRGNYGFCSGYIKSGNCIIKSDYFCNFFTECHIIDNNRDPETINGITSKTLKISSEIRVELPQKLPPECSNTSGSAILLKYLTKEQNYQLDSNNLVLSDFGDKIRPTISGSTIKIKFIQNGNQPFIGQITVNNELVELGISMDYQSTYEVKYIRPDMPTSAYEESIDYYLEESNVCVSNLSTIKISMCPLGCSCYLNNKQCDYFCYDTYYFFDKDYSYCKPLSQIEIDYPGLKGLYQPDNYSFEKCNVRCLSCDRESTSNINIGEIHNCLECSPNYNNYYGYTDDTYTHKNCYNIPCNQVKNTFREIENTGRCIFHDCQNDQSIYKFNLNNEKCFASCPQPYLTIDYNTPYNKTCVDNCPPDYPVHDISNDYCSNLKPLWNII